MESMAVNASASSAPKSMRKRRIFVAGERGQVANALAEVYTERGCNVLCAGRATLDIGDPVATASQIAAFRPDLVVNAAAFTEVDRAETDRDQAFRINSDGARHLAAAARAVDAPLIHISTDYVYDGRKASPYVEADATNPLSVYGASKLAGEQAIAETTGDYVILRTSWVYSPHGHNFAKTMIRLAMMRDRLDVVEDQHGAPTLATELAKAIHSIGERLLVNPERLKLSGVYHAAGSGRTTWYGFARAIIDRLAVKTGRQVQVHAITTEQFPRPARRPSNSLLDCSKLERAFGVRLPDWTASLDGCMDQLLKRTLETVP